MAGHPSEAELIPLNISLPISVIERIVGEARARDCTREDIRLALAKQLLASRRRRDKELPCIRLGEPNWDMILDLYIATLEGRRVDMSGFCLASGVAPTTAVRYVEILIEDGFLARVADMRDGRRTFITMTTALREPFERWLDAEAAAIGLMAALGPGR